MTILSNIWKYFVAFVRGFMEQSMDIGKIMLYWGVYISVVGLLFAINDKDFWIYAALFIFITAPLLAGIASVLDLFVNKIKETE